MMNKIFENEFTIVEANSENNTVYFRYKNVDDGDLMHEDHYKQAMLVYGKYVHEHKCERLLCNLVHSKFAIVPELQEWTAQEIAPLTISLKKMAFVMSPDIFSQVSLEQMMEEDGIADKYNAPRYFESEEDANEWLFA